MFQRKGPRIHQALTERQRHVFRGVFDGLTNKEIADHLGVSESAVKGTLQQLFRKTCVRTRVQLVRIVLEHSLGVPPIRALTRLRWR